MKSFEPLPFSALQSHMHGMQVLSIIKSYNISTLLESHVPGTRQWLFDCVNKWLEAALSAGKDATSLDHHRMFLLLAGPGMGKSVFSAVMEKKLVVHMHAGQKLIQVGGFGYDYLCLIGVLSKNV